jgi:maltooligosyltrehalose trehalohydrolase
MEWRQRLPALAALEKEHLQVVSQETPRSLVILRKHGNCEIYLAFNFDQNPIAPFFPGTLGRWRKRIDSSEEKWLGPGSSIPAVFDPKSSMFVQPGRSLVLLERAEP